MKKILDQKEIHGLKQLCGYKKIQVENFFAPIKIIRSEKNLGPKKIA